MSESPPNDGKPQVREFVKENAERLYSFCFYMLEEGMSLDDLVLTIFRDFGDEYRQLGRHRDTAWAPNELRVRLYRIAWNAIKEALFHQQISWSPGRDMRVLKGMDDDLLREWSSGENKSERGAGAVRGIGDPDPGVTDRLRKVTADFRVAVVLRDILGFGDEDVVRILDLRWGVYRHRLHRGRLEFKDQLKGRATSGSKPPVEQTSQLW